jgi:hypothetical protein
MCEMGISARLEGILNQWPTHDHYFRRFSKCFSKTVRLNLAADAGCEPSRNIAPQRPLRLGRMSQNSSYPERFVMEDLGYNSKAVHFAYAKRALVKIPSL